MQTSLLQSNALKIPLADKKVHCVITSPPYYGLRDYSAPGQLGLEPTLQEYIDNTVLWCREVWRVLRDDGVFFLNFGDSYARAGGWSDNSGLDGQRRGESGRAKTYNNIVSPGFKEKDLMLVPHRVAIALQNDGWWVRSDIVWHKPNPMPESVTDRPTKSHEYIFLLAKSKKYYYDADSIREKHQDPADIHRRIKKDGEYKHDKSQRGWMDGSEERADLAVSRGRNKRSVWTITTKPYKGAHFATFPPEIPEICIKAGTSEKGVCPVCGSQWARVVEHENMVIRRSERTHSMGRTRSSGTMEKPAVSKTIGWKPTCSHNEEPIPATVLDCFGGSGTTAAVAKQLGRIGICMDLSWEYLQLAKKRCGKVEYQYSFNETLTR